MMKVFVEFLCICLSVTIVQINVRAKEICDVTRGEMASKVVQAMEEVVEVEYGMTCFSYPPFKDLTEGEYLENKNILIAYSLGLMFGTGEGAFEPKEYITRAQSAAIFERLIKAIDDELDLKQTYIVLDEKYEDDEKIPLWAKESVYNMRWLKIIVGDENNRFNPQENLKEEHIDSILERIKNNYKIYHDKGRRNEEQY